MRAKDFTKEDIWVTNKHRQKTFNYQWLDYNLTYFYLNHCRAGNTQKGNTFSEAFIRIKLYLT